MKRNVLVLGAGGFVGQHLLEYANILPDCLFIPVFHSAGNTGEYVDITDKKAIEALFDRTNPEIVVNLTCVPVAACEKFPEIAHTVQVQGAQNVAQSCASRCRLLHLSSDMVFSGNKADRYLPTDTPDPISVYGKTKVEGEENVVRFATNYAIVRSALVIGRDRRGNRGFIEWMLRNIRQRTSFPLFVDQYRTPIIIEDLVCCLVSLAIQNCTGIFHAAGDLRVNRVSMGEWLCEGMRLASMPFIKCKMTDQDNGVPQQADLSMDNAQMKRTCALTCGDTKNYITALGRRAYEGSGDSAENQPNNRAHK